MLFSCAIFLLLVAWLIVSLVWLFSPETRKRGLVSLVIAVAVFVFIAWWSDPGTMRDKPPAMEDLVGTWECFDISSGYLKSAGLTRKSFSSQLVLQSDHRFSSRGSLGDGRFSSFSSSWELREPGMTPAGAWTIEVDSDPYPGPYRFVCRKKLGRITLRKTINLTYGYSASYRRVSSDTEPRKANTNSH